jgi:hypothetical protein
MNPSKAETVEVNPGDVPVVTMSCLGRIGRFGNQLFQYAFLRHYARTYGLAVETPPWVGQKLFGCSDPPIARSLPTVYEPSWDVEAALATKPRQIVKNADLWGYFLLPSSVYAPERRWFRELFRPVGEVAVTVNAAAEKLRQRGGTIIGLHLRRGDKTSGRHALTPLDAYTGWLRERWRSWRSPALFIATDDPRVVTEFSEFQPILAAELGGETNPGFYLDFFLLTQSDLLLISNSTFSFAAAMLNERATQFIRPIPDRRELIEFDPWDALPVLPDDVKARDYYAGLLERAATAEDEQDYRAVRSDIADNWVGAAGSEGTLVEGYFGPLGQAHRLCMGSPLRKVPLDGADTAHRDQLLSAFESGLPDDWTTAYVLAAMLYCDADELRGLVSKASVAEFLREDLGALLGGRLS